MAKKIFEVEISNGSSKGYETATTLEMPCTQSELRDALQKARIQDIRKCSNKLTKISYLGITSDMIGQNVDLLDLNLLAGRLSILREDDQIGMKCLLKVEMEKSGGPIPLSRLIDLTFNTDICFFVPNVFNKQELGEFLYESKRLPQETMALVDTTKEGSNIRKWMLQVAAEQYQEEHDGVFISRGYAEPGDGFKEIYQKGEMFCFARSSAPVVLEVSKGFFDDPGYDNDQTTILNLPAEEADILRVVGEVDAASVDECSFRCIDCEVPSLRDAVNDAIDQEGGIDMAHEFAKILVQNKPNWNEVVWIKYKALLSVAGHPSLQEAIELMDSIGLCELRPEIAEPWDYMEMVLREKYPDLPDELFQSPRAAQIGQKWLEKGDAAITEYGLIRRKDGGLLPSFHPKQEQQTQIKHGGMEMR